MIDKRYCMSSYLAFRYIEREDIDFYEGLHHLNFKPVPNNEKIEVRTAEEIGKQIQNRISEVSDKKIGIMLSGGMDSAIIASYMSGCDAYTFRFLGGKMQEKELERAKYYAKQYKLKLHYVDIDWQVVEKNLDKLMIAKGAPVHSIETQILQAALQAQSDGIELMLVGESSDLIFGGMDQLLSKDWTLDEFQRRYIFTQPADVLKDPQDMSYLFEKYRNGDKIDFLKFMDDIFSIESSGSYMNAFEVAKLSYMDSYANLKMAEPLDLYRVRHGEPKYLIRELMHSRYPDIPVPNKIPMPRPVDLYFEEWQGPKRKEFRDDIDMNTLTGNQKWQLYCLERFLNLYEA